jgi:DNA mismatch repair protein MutL
VPRIAKLPGHVANQIAAGEVVARPASVVKELIENALDAGATTIRVDVEKGGVGLVRVVDDGCGMEREDALLALERHATSKLRTADELRSIATLGFRGEALPSIASVSQFVLRTRTAGGDEGVEVSTSGGEEPRAVPSGGATGTTIEVSDLFYNVPARRKFLRALATESAHVTDAVRQTALANPAVQFELWKDGRLFKRWLRAASNEERARDVLEDQVTIVVSGEHGPLHVEAYLCAPERARSGAAGLTIVVNRRPVQDRAIARAVALAYGDRIERGTFPVGVVLIELPMDLCDVNVHPQKTEVRFAHPRAVSDAVYAAVQSAMPQKVQDGAAVPERAPTGPDRGRGVWPSARSDRALDAWSWGASAREPERAFALDLAPARAELPAREPTHDAAPRLTLLAELDGIVVAADERMVWFLDRHRLAARVIELRAKAELARGSLAAQQLLFPVRLEVAEREQQAVDAHADALARLGFELRSTGPRTVTVHGLPRVWAHGSPEQLARLAIAHVDRDESELVRAASKIAARADRGAGDAATLLTTWRAAHAGSDARDLPEVLEQVSLTSLHVRLDR